MPQLDKYCLMTLMILTTFLAIFLHATFTGLAKAIRYTIVVRFISERFKKRIEEATRSNEIKRKITDKYFADRFSTLKEQMDRADARIKKQLSEV